MQRVPLLHERVDLVELFLLVVADLVALVLRDDALGADEGLAVVAEVFGLLLRMLQTKLIHKRLARVLPRILPPLLLLRGGNGRLPIRTMYGGADAAVLVRVFLVVDVVCRNGK